MDSAFAASRFVASASGRTGSRAIDQGMAGAVLLRETAPLSWPGSRVVFCDGEGAEQVRPPHLGWYVALMAAGLPELSLGIGDDRLTNAPWLIGRRINDRTAVTGCPFRGLVDIVNEDEGHGPQRVARDRIDNIGSVPQSETNRDHRVPDRQLCVADPIVRQGHPQRLRSTEEHCQPPNSDGWVQIAEVRNNSRVTPLRVEHAHDR